MAEKECEDRQNWEDGEDLTIVTNMTDATVETNVTDGEEDTNGDMNDETAGDAGEDEAESNGRERRKPIFDNLIQNQLTTEERVARRKKLAADRRNAASDMPDWVRSQPKIVQKRWQFHALKSFQAGPVGRSSGKVLDAMTATYGPRWRSQIDPAAEAEAESDALKAPKYKHLPLPCSLLAEIADQAIGETLARWDIGACVTREEELVIYGAKTIGLSSDNSDRARTRRQLLERVRQALEPILPEMRAFAGAAGLLDARDETPALPAETEDDYDA